MPRLVNVKTARNPEPRRRVHHRRHIDDFYHIRAFIEEKMFSKIHESKDLAEMRGRMSALVKNERFWKAMADLDSTVDELKASLPR